MRQCNTSGSPLDIPSIPASVPPGGEVDYPELLAGFEPVETEPKSRVSKAASSATTKEE